MIRHFLNLVLVAALLGNQAVCCCGHTHGESGEHTSRAHVHIGGYSHSHCSCCDHHHNENDNHLHHGSQHADKSDLSLSNTFDHDGDAIYLVEEQPIHSLASDHSLKKSPVASTTPQLVLYRYPYSQLEPPRYSAVLTAFTAAHYLRTIRLLI